MSAYIVNPTHIGALAAYLLKQKYPNIERGLEGKNSKQTLINVAKCLMAENIKSVACRYPNYKQGERPGSCGYSDKELVEESACTAAVYVGSFPKLQAIDIIAMCNSLEYQSCETDEYEQSLAYKQLQRIKGGAIINLDGYDVAVRDFCDERFNEAAS